MGFSVVQKKASLVGAFFIALLFTSQAQAFCPLPGNLPKVKVQRVVDGDTLRLVDGRSVRLLGLNAPELSHQGRPTEAFAEAARERLQDLVEASSGRVTLQVGEQAKDHYGRTLGHIYGSNGANFEAQLLAEGLAYAVAVAPNLSLVDCQVQAERSARQAGLGLWQKPPVQSPQQLRSSGFSLIQGRIKRVERNGGGLWLEMGDSLVLQIPKRLFKYFDLKELEALEGQRVEARGWLVDRNQRGGAGKGQARWLLPITATSMLQVLP
ncbi:thermonuclease family protein [Pseudomonas sp. 5P_3.1_Bac2]|uniref:thermonuclease family protein n=1 Tax=Pseudomonas sp. 5P_3.1_Bac2 TaxID=2971617 RepID=UPI0021C768AC|nr:thermonuclease family protein [Pseudomonas sp. 5P_3.1_Bac2]MCU1718408.1 thermonuclease family protein [Pseudomonas sp. 5P_3.1_Bac2]